MSLSYLFSVLAQTLSIYSLILVVRLVLTWFPNLPWENPVLSAVSAICDPYLNIFRGLIPPSAASTSPPWWPCWPSSCPAACWSSWRWPRAPPWPAGDSETFQILLQGQPFLAVVDPCPHRCPESPGPQLTHLQRSCCSGRH